MNRLATLVVGLREVVSWPRYGPRSMLKAAMRRTTALSGAMAVGVVGLEMVVIGCWNSL